MKWCLHVPCLAMILAAGPAIAGSATYNRTTRTYSLTYTFANLPGADGLMRLGGAFEPGQVQDPPPQRLRQIEGEIHRILSDVNRKLLVATRGNAQVGSLTYVRDARTADLIIALDSPSDRGGVAVPLGGAGDGRPGHFYLYYDSLKGYANGNRDGVVDTIAHELCHYFFGLPDEYRDRSAAPRCPLTPGPGCLMDNYWIRGTTGALCDDRNHNPLAPSAVFNGDRSDSCQSILRRFFQGIGLSFDDASSRPALEIRPHSGDPVASIGSELPDGLAERLARASTGSAEQRASTVFRQLREASESNGRTDDPTLLRLYELASEVTARVGPADSKSEPDPVQTVQRRRSLVIAPDPPAIGAGGPEVGARRIEEYNRHRDDGVRQFLSATDRRQFDVWTEGANERKDGQGGEADPARIATDLLGRIERDGIEVVTVLVPPHGLSPSTNKVFSAMRRSYLAGDRPSLRRLRLNLGLVEDSAVTAEMRDLCLRSGGTILTITDLDEIGAVMQRLALDQSSGNWVIVPEKGILRIPAADLAVAAFANPGDAKVFSAYRSALDAFRASDRAQIQDASSPRAEWKPLRERIWPFLVEHRAIRFLDDRDRLSADGSVEIVLKPFYVDGMSDFELIVGLSESLTGLAGVGPPAPDDSRLLPRLGFRTGPGPERVGASPGPIDRSAIETGSIGPLDPLEEELAPDLSRSSGSALVYRLPSPRERGLSEGWYTPVLRLPRRSLGSNRDGKFLPAAFRGGSLRYTFSVGTPHAASQIQAGIIQARTFPTRSEGRAVDRARETDAEGDIYRGSLDAREDFAVLQAEVRAGVPVAGAVVRGYSQRLEDRTDRPVRTVPIVFRDDGVGDDLKPDDGIYTAVLGLARDDRRAAEYRVFVEASTVDGARLVPLDPHGPVDRGQAVAAPKFQRATSFQFRLPARVEK